MNHWWLVFVDLVNVAKYLMPLLGGGIFLKSFMIEIEEGDLDEFETDSKDTAMWIGIFIYVLGIYLIRNW